MNTQNIDRARDVLLTYGANPARWPENERQAVEDCIRHTAALQALQNQQAQLDRHLATAHHGLTEENRAKTDSLIANVFSRLPELYTKERWFSSTIKQILQVTSALWSRPFKVAYASLAVLATCGFLFLSIGVNKIADTEIGLALEQWILPEVANSVAETNKVNSDLENMLAYLEPELSSDFSSELFTDEI